MITFPEGFSGNRTIMAEITQIDEIFIERLAVILETICCNFAIDVKNLGYMLKKQLMYP